MQKSPFIRNLLNHLKKLFFPPAGTPRWMRVLPYAILGVLTLVVFLGGTYAWEYTNSSEFCGTTCHTMPPEYSAYLVSPHARVDCVECHIGRDAFTEVFSRKAGDLRHVVLNLTKAYEFPIRAHNMRPARESCETCHFPEKFSHDTLVQVQKYASDESNTQRDLYLLMKTGGGSAREGLGQGIHWHIENQVMYLATDDFDQEIPYVRVVDDEGTVTEYYDITADLAPEDVAGEYLQEMDCITCHNRVTHRVPNPEDAISQAIRKGLISEELPYVVREGAVLLRGEYADKESAIAAMGNLADFYEEEYPGIFRSRAEEVEQAVATLKEIYTQNVFPEQKSDWDTHSDNLGHREDPGCFRCHDGNHMTVENEAIRLECNLCHSIPVTSDPEELTTNIELVSGPEPYSHTLTNWMTLHGKAKDNTCTACHTTPEGYENLADLKDKPPTDDSFCGNEACHGNVWTYAGFNAPELQPILEEQMQALLSVSPFLLEGKELTWTDTFAHVFEGRCAGCHTGDNAPAGFNVGSYRGVLAGGNSGPGIVPSDPQASVVYQRQSAGDHFGQLLDDELEALVEWIEAGAPE